MFQTIYIKKTEKVRNTAQVAIINNNSWTLLEKKELYKNIEKRLENKYVLIILNYYEIGCGKRKEWKSKKISGYIFYMRKKLKAGKALDKISHLLAVKCTGNEHKD